MLKRFVLLAAVGAVAAVGIWAMGAEAPLADVVYSVPATPPGPRELFRIKDGGRGKVVFLADKDEVVRSLVGTIADLSGQLQAAQAQLANERSRADACGQAKPKMFAVPIAKPDPRSAHTKAAK